MKRLLLLLPVLLSSVACLSAKAQLSSYHFYLSHNAIHYCLYQEGYYSVDEYISEVTSFVEKTDISHRQAANFIERPSFKSDRKHLIKQMGGCKFVARSWNKTSLQQGR